MQLKTVSFFAIISLLVMASPPAAALMVEIPFTELVSGSDSIVIGTIKSVESSWNEDQTLIRTYATVAVEQNVAKTPVDDIITIVVDGGTADGITLWVSDTPILLPDKKVGVMLRLETPSLYTPYGRTQGVYALRDDTVASTILSADVKPDRTEMGGGLTPDQFILAVRDAEEGIEPSFDTEIPKPVGVAEYSPGQLSSGSLSPSTASAGTSATVTISGSGFGEKASRGSNADVAFFFIRAGERSYYPIYATGRLPASDWQKVNRDDIISWSDTEIVTRVPTGIAWRGIWYSGSAGSGPVAVLTDNGELFGPYSLSVPFGWSKAGSLPNPLYWPGTSPVVEYYVSDPGIPGAVSAVQSAADTWTNVPGAMFSFVYAGYTDATEVGRNGINEIVWADDGPGDLGVATLWFLQSTGEVFEVDMLLNTYYSLSTNPGSGEYDIESIALHELGHWIGLADLYGDFPGYPTDTNKVMFGFGSPGKINRSLHSGDQQGIEYIYPVISVEPPQPVDLSIPVTITAGANEQILTFGTDPDGTEGFDSGLDVAAPPLPPGAAFDAVFMTSDPLFPRLYTDIRGEIDDADPERHWEIQIISTEEDATLTWDPTQMPDELTCNLIYAGTRYDMRSVSEITVLKSEDGTAQRIDITLSSWMEMTLPLAAGWNLVSIPYSNADFTLPTPNPIQVVYAYNPATRAYVATELEEMEPGQAYWVASTSATEITVTGTPASPITSDLTTGWNLIGGTDQAVAFGSIAIDPVGAWAMQLVYGYDTGTRAYEQTTTLVPGAGYWGAVTADSTITIGEV